MLRYRAAAAERSVGMKLGTPGASAVERLPAARVGAPGSRDRALRRAPRGGLLLPRPGPLSLSVCLLMNKCWGKKKLGCMNPIFDSSHVRRGLCRVWRGHWGAMSRAPPPLSQRRCPDAPAQGPSPSSPETVSPAAATCSVMRAGVAFRSPWRLRLDRGSLGLEALPEGRWGRGCRALPRLASAP